MVEAFCDSSHGRYAILRTMQKDTLRTDIIIFGGGVAGLWLLNRLTTAGYSVLLFETEALGRGQTLASQGMVHGGIKYALGGALSGASETIGAMPERWRHCLAGDDEVDLSGVRVLSDHFYMWSSASMTSKFTAFAASKALRGRIDRLPPADWPVVFQDPKFKGHVYSLYDPVLDTTSLVEQLAAPCRDHIFKIDWEHAKLQRDAAAQQLQSLCLETGDGNVELKAQLFIAAAGEGNAQIIADAAADKPEMQCRPLHQVVLTHASLPSLYAHALGSKSSPRVTISTHFTSSVQPLWYLGGDLATEGVKRDAQHQIAFAQQELAGLLPWVDLSDADWRSFSIDRAEPRQTQLIKPDDAFAEFASACANLLVCWPTKLTLTPRLGDIVSNQVTQTDIKPQIAKDEAIAGLQEILPHAQVAPPIWDALFA
ncbi:MAG: FAD-dependent oxidoreductase [Pseudomonadales bacterium]